MRFYSILTPFFFIKTSFFLNSQYKLHSVVSFSVYTENKMIRIDEIRRIGLLLFLAVCGMFGNEACGQNVAIKTNILSLATTTLNLGAEIRLKPKMTINVEASYNPWDFADNKKLKHFILQPELRLWQCESFNRGFFGVHAMFGKFNAGGVKIPMSIWEGMEENRYEGLLTGVGLSYGWNWFLGRHWSAEATFGFGYMYLDYKKYECRKCGDFQAKEKKHYFGPTKMAVSFMYLF